ncbi:MAG: NUDIX hydrolase [Candidatus Gastranaerophilales bacterium]|nr:NUDIX hydrolase [Candidatus Gastranaerophilales bacterium]
MATIAESKFLNFKSAKSPEGHDWFYVHRTNDTDKHDSAVVITTLVKKDGEYNFLFLKTKRPPIYAENKAEYCLESPAGLIGDINISETLEECAKKELLEETGLKADKIYTELLNSSTSAGLSSETLSYVTAVVDEYKVIEQPVSDGGIIAERFFVPAKDIKSFLQKIDCKKYSVAAATVCGIFFALSRI